MQIHALCRPAITAVQQLHRSTPAAAVGLAVLGNSDQCVDRKTGILVSLHHDVPELAIDFATRASFQSTFRAYSLGVFFSPQAAGVEV